MSIWWRFAKHGQKSHEREAKQDSFLWRCGLANLGRCYFLNSVSVVAKRQMKGRNRTFNSRNIALSFFFPPPPKIRPKVDPVLPLPSVTTVEGESKVSENHGAFSGWNGSKFNCQLMGSLRSPRQRNEKLVATRVGSALRGEGRDISMSKRSRLSTLSSLSLSQHLVSAERRKPPYNYG